jgi:hypothetical protein
MYVFLGGVVSGENGQLSDFFLFPNVNEMLPLFQRLVFLTLATPPELMSVVGFTGGTVFYLGKNISDPLPTRTFYISQDQGGSTYTWAAEAQQGAFPSATCLSGVTLTIFPGPDGSTFKPNIASRVTTVDETGSSLSEPFITFPNALSTADNSRYCQPGQ